ncbi:MULTISPECIES: protein-L-isoaspartate O-methyltransferase [Devosia]|uniref:Protein-L-isoaspartate O-methyltransferase n=1 Tax=Devosia equisanguinis TaxID=2490941 RepID=A0A3S5D3M5_9HYPH|nr:MULTISPECIES: protein-L-isoaspartate O-methyltransferase [Devosia]ODT50337.1 MAG: hypothetical protein ABS74_05365 [Pelagibacterium sp. SCN 63-126]ODU86503.1 MAG: hypothetical protein ABT14_08485 [Pelagibacterium sp. SCN 63-17]OJX45081.1 MAG: hypothetical protein BGO80_04365 [Devosia sp. 63-57]VDS06203.1 Protein-L-isoaspartate O-methyltransferase [Devosia equisanguinis]
MVDYARARRAMVDSQLSTSGVYDRRLLSAMGRLPREMFVPEPRKAIAYIDEPHLMREGSGRFLAAPAVFARLVELADIGEQDEVLDLGAGSGYSTAVLACLSAHVLGLEADAALVDEANARLAALGLDTARVVFGDEHSLNAEMFDVIIVEGALPDAPADLIARLRPGGRLVALIRQGGVGVATVYLNGVDGVTARTEFNASLHDLRPAAAGERFVF